MEKKINSEIKIHDNDFKIKIGTTNKKNPETLYVQIGTYIKPCSIKLMFKESILSLRKSS